jgi:ferredoxin
MTPHLRFDSDYCREDCSRCGQACPTGAIQRLDLASKRRRIIGIARLDADTCIMAEGRECGLCKARCPYDAIALRTTDGGFTVVPAVIATACIGCGACQAVCPVSPTPAIRVSERATV